MTVKFNRSGAKALLKKGVTKLAMCRILRVSRPWLDELLTTRAAMRHDAITKEMNDRIDKMLAYLAKVKK